jgi:adenine-specific DNA-methyltransferase
MEGKSLNIAQDLLEKLKELVPQAFSEEKLDMQKLRALLGEAVNTDNERYQLSWAGKSEAYKVLQIPTTATLIPQPEQSVNWDESENIFIEGENLEVLKVLQKSYYGKIKMIYIDPPYNTGSDSFIYPDKFSESKEEYLRRIGEKDEEGYMMKEGVFRKNSKENGQFHSNWLNMMLPRLFLARNLLKDDGVIFISIDDNEQANLKLLMDEIFGEDNFVANVIWQKKYSPQNDAKWFSNMHDHILVYAKSKEVWRPYLLERTEEQNARYSNPDNDPRGDWKSTDFSVKTYSKEYDYPITTPSGKVINPPPSRCWVTSKDNFEKLVAEDRIWFGSSGENVPSLKKFLTEVKNGITPSTIWFRTDVGDNQEAAKELRELFQNPPFDTPKPTRLIKRMLSLATDKDSNDIVLDFFSGSGTTGQAVIDMNKGDGGNRKFICVQLPEVISEGDEAFKTGFKSISDVASARIKKFLDKVKSEERGKLAFNKTQIFGFRKYALSPSNFKFWRGDLLENEAELTKQMELFVTPQRANAQSENILWELLIKNGVSLTEKIQRIEVGEEASIYHTSDKRFAFVLDKFTAEVQGGVLALKPRTVICLDSLFQNQDMVKTNAQLKFEDNDITFKTV